MYNFQNKSKFVYQNNPSESLQKPDNFEVKEKTAEEMERELDKAKKEVESGKKEIDVNLDEAKSVAKNLNPEDQGRINEKIQKIGQHEEEVASLQTKAKKTVEQNLKEQENFKQDKAEKIEDMLGAEKEEKTETQKPETNTAKTTLAETQNPVTGEVTQDQKQPEDNTKNLSGEKTDAKEEEREIVEMTNNETEEQQKAA